VLASSASASGVSVSGKLSHVDAMARGPSRRVARPRLEATQGLAKAIAGVGRGIVDVGSELDEHREAERQAQVVGLRRPEPLLEQSLGARPLVPVCERAAQLRKLYRRKSSHGQASYRAARDNEDTRLPAP